MCSTGAGIGVIFEKNLNTFSQTKEAGEIKPFITNCLLTEGFLVRLSNT